MTAGADDTPLAVQLGPSGPIMNERLRVLGRIASRLDPAAAEVVSTPGETLVLSPEIAKSVGIALAVLAGSESEPAPDRFRAHELLALLNAAQERGCVRSPCGVNDPKVERARLEQARREVGGSLPAERPDGLLYIAYGLGVDSTAILVGLERIVHEGRKDFRPDFIVFADTGAETQRTYDYVEVVNRWLDKVGFPRVEVAAYATEFAAKSFGSSRTLEQQVLLTQHLPAYSATKTKMATCSLLWKQTAQQKWLELRSGLYDHVGGRSYRPKPGVKLVKAIGYDAEEEDRREHGDTFRVEDDQRLHKRGVENIFSYWFPLMAWKWDRARCIAEIEASIGVVPPKSACHFCGASKRDEIRRLPKDELLRALLVEQVALNGWHAAEYAENRNKGLGINFSWTEFALTEGLVTRREHAALMKKALEIAALPQERRSEGGENLADHPVIRRLPAFRDVRGLRDRYEGIWDRYHDLPEDKRAEA